MTTKANRIERYYDSHLRDDEELSQTFFHQAAIEYLVAVLRWLYFAEKMGIATSINFYHAAFFGIPLSPDIAVVDGLEIDGRKPNEERSYYVGRDGPPPRVVVEMSSEGTWPTDLTEKVVKYAQMGVLEYIAFDPHQPSVWTKEWKPKGRLLGWRLDSTTGVYQEISKNADGWLWSEQLDSWLLVDDKYLRLRTSAGELRLDRGDAEHYQFITEQQRADAERQAREIESRRAEAESRRAEVESRRADAERQAREIESRRAEAEREAKEVALKEAELERARLEELREKIRKLGLDPDKL